MTLSHPQAYLGQNIVNVDAVRAVLPIAHTLQVIMYQLSASGLYIQHQGLYRPRVPPKRVIAVGVSTLAIFNPQRLNR